MDAGFVFVFEGFEYDVAYVSVEAEGAKTSSEGACVFVSEPVLGCLGAEEAMPVGLELFAEVVYAAQGGEHFMVEAEAGL